MKSRSRRGGVDEHAQDPSTSIFLFRFLVAAAAAAASQDSHTQGNQRSTSAKA
jgi:hypothetical protein